MLASTLSKTEIMVLNVYREGCISQDAPARYCTSRHVETSIIQSRRFAERKLLRNHRAASPATGATLPGKMLLSEEQKGAKRKWNRRWNEKRKKDIR